MSSDQSTSVFAKVTKVFIDALKTGAPPWRKPWSECSSTSGFPVNAGTERRYSGINVTILWAAAITHSYEYDRWLSFRQAKKLGGKIRKGEKGTIAVLFKNIDVSQPSSTEKERENNVEPPRNYRIARAYTLFNVEQCIGLPKEVVRGRDPFQVQVHHWQPHHSADDLIKYCGAKIRHAGSTATYFPNSDVICMPPKGAFDSSAGYYSTLLHELTHWTGHKTRLNRTGIVEPYPFRSEGYALEELIAEIGSAFLCADFQILGEMRHESYVLDWVRILENDSKAIFSSSALAWKARNYLIGKFPTNAFENHVEQNSCQLKSMQ